MSFKINLFLIGARKFVVKSRSHFTKVIMRRGEGYHGNKVTFLRRQKMADGGWRMADGGWRMADGGWRMADGGWRMAIPRVLTQQNQAH
jgi:hypothetical protein